jgi:aspartyl-tRNA(Asn)/glutamyl-tRNA(Gln) amidotransferase subunit A
MLSMPESFPRTIAEASRLIRSRALSPIELVRALLERIETIDPVISSFITVTADVALEQARKAESEIAKGMYRGPLHGIPFGAKDNYNTRGILTTGHSKVYERHVPGENAAVIDQLYDSGAVLMGKLALHELAHGGPSFDLPWPPARNPWNPVHFTAGSSSGSAAALAADLVLFSLGSDTGGSIRGPAALCGLVGMKPTFGLVSRYGVIPNSWSLDHCGPLAKTVEDCALVMQAMSDYDPRDRGSVPGQRPDLLRALRRDLKGVRVGVLRHFFEEGAALDPQLTAASEEALRVMTSLGATLETVRLRPLRDYGDVWALIEAPETFSIQRKALETRPQDFGAVFLERTLIACLIAASDYVDAQRMRAQVVGEMKAVWDKYDVLVAPGAGPAPKLGPALATWPSLNRNSPFALMGTPAIVVPCGYSDSGLPLSIQFVAKPFDDAALLGIAHAYEHATGFGSQRTPAVPVEPPPRIVYERPPVDLAKLDARVVSLCERATAAAGLKLGEPELAILCGAAPHLIEIRDRVRGAGGSAEPANVFVLS